MKKIYNFNKFKILEWEEVSGRIPRANWIEYMDILYSEIKKQIVPIISSKFKVDYDKGKLITIHTDNKKDLTISVGINDDKINYSVKPVKGVEFEFNYNLSNNITQIINSIKDEFKKDPYNGLHQEQGNVPKFIDEDDITPRKKSIKRSIDINIIKSILEDSFILDEIDLKNITIEELLRRMLKESRK